METSKDNEGGGGGVDNNESYMEVSCAKNPDDSEGTGSPADESITVPELCNRLSQSLYALIRMGVGRDGGGAMGPFPERQFSEALQDLVFLLLSKDTPEPEQRYYYHVTYYRFNIGDSDAQRRLQTLTILAHTEEETREAFAQILNLPDTLTSRTIITKIERGAPE